MYDRQTWVIVALCGGLIASSLYFQTEQQRKEAEKQKQETERKKWEQKAVPDAPAVPSAADPTQPVDPAAQAQPGLTEETPPPPTEESLIRLENDKVAFTLTNVGGGIKYAEFKEEFEVGSKTVPVKMNRYAAGAIGTFAAADHTLDQSVFSYLEKDSIPGKKAVYIKALPSGLIAKKSYTLIEEKDKIGSQYLLDFSLTVENSTPNPINLNQWSIFIGEATPLYQAEVGQQTGFFWHEDRSMHFKDSSAFKGGWFGSPKDVLTSPAGETLDYAGVTNQFFTTVLRPTAPYSATAWARHQDEQIKAGNKAVSSVRAGLSLPSVTLAPKEVKAFTYRIFMGPKHNDMLRKMEKYWGSGWGDVMQYGDWMQWPARPLNWLLNFYHRLLDGVAKNWSWGLAIILLTVTVRALIWPLHAKSTHTMKRMSKLQPEIAKLKEKYADDPNKLNQEMMGLYKKFGINPLGGCLPMLIQIPVFFGFYRMLQYAVELRGESFLWVSDLSQPDTLYTFHLPFALPLLGAELPINILPIVMAISSFAQMAMMPKAGDPMQQKIMKFMPLMFFFFCYNFASALALYWTTQNIFSIVQTWLMNKIPEPELKARPDSGKKSFIQRAAERQMELQKEREKAGGMKNVTPDATKKKRTPRTGG